MFYSIFKVIISPSLDKIIRIISYINHLLSLGSKKKTKTLLRQIENPAWNDEIKFEFTSSSQQKSQQIEVELKDKERIGSDK